jgi:hypothetical protein
MKTTKYFISLVSVFLLGMYFIPASHAAFWEKSKKEESKKDAKTETKTIQPAAAATGPSPTLTLVSPKTSSVKGPFHVAVELTPDAGFDQLIVRSMGSDIACNKDFNLNEKYELDCDTGKLPDGTSFVLQAQAFSKAKNAVVASYSQVLMVGNAPAAPAAKTAVASKKAATKVSKEMASKASSKEPMAKAPAESPKL